MNFKLILYSNTGKIIISVILGLGIACLFHKACKDKECITFSGPVISNIDGKIFQHDGKCYTYKAKTVKCDSTKKTIEFGVTPPSEETGNVPSSLSSSISSPVSSSMSSISSSSFMPSFFTPIRPTS